MPRIAITSCSKLHDYEEAVRHAGGEPIVVDPSTGLPEDIVTECDGLLLTGGGDVEPVLYAEQAHPTFKAAEAGRDAFEIALVQEASKQDLPLFAICRGIQVLNVARGGTLIQDIPSQVPHAQEHKIGEPPDSIAHDVAIVPGSQLDSLVRGQVDHASSCAVNSRHHQAIKRVGAGLVVTATASDGVIEAVEDPSRRFCLGVQWHPENFSRTGRFASLFAALVRAAAGQKSR